jgi:membrane protein DedA with SNARE-associated domain
MRDLISSTVSFVQEHEGWGVVIVFVLAFCESFAFISLLVPATGILFGVGGLIPAFGIRFWPIWIAAALGAVAGDWLAYDLALRARDRIKRIPLYASNAELVAHGIKFFERWGMIAVFSGRFFGPLRAIVPIVAGLYAMPWIKFQVANIASAVLWATAILTPGFLGVRWLIG